MNKRLAYRVIFVAVVAALCVMALRGNELQTVRTGPTVLPAQAASSTPQEQQAPTVAPPPLSQYIEITDSCGPYFDGVCVNMRSGPGTEYPVVLKLRTGVVLRVAETVTSEGQQWYKIGFDEELRYPERVTGGWYVAAGDYLQLFADEGTRQLPVGASILSTKRIIVDLSGEMLYAYDGDTLFMQDPISTGLDATPTPTGTFIIYKKTPSRYMQGPIPGVSDQYYDLPGVPWDLYFTYGGAVIHGAYWHNHFGEPWSHGCVNLAPQEAKKLYQWADVGTVVIVRN